MPALPEHSIQDFGIEFSHVQASGNKTASAYMGMATVKRSSLLEISVQWRPIHSLPQALTKPTANQPEAAQRPATRSQKLIPSRDAATCRLGRHRAS